MKYNLRFASFALLLASCNNLEDVSSADRKTFVKVIEGPNDLTASSVERIPGGYVILGNETVTVLGTTTTQAVLIQVTEKGDRVGEIHRFPGGTGKSFKPLIENGAVTGYIVVGDIIYIDPQAAQAANVSIASMRMLYIDADFQTDNSRSHTISDVTSTGTAVKADYFAGAVNVTPNGGVIILGTYREGVTNQQSAPEKQFLFALDANQDSLWYKEYELLSNTYANAKSVHYYNESIFWATAVADVQGEFTSSYLAIPKVHEGSVFENANPYGQNSTQLFLPKDIQPARSGGFGVIGTYSELTDGSKSNIFFVRVDITGQIQQNSERYFDAIESFKPAASNIDKNVSSIIDEGEAIFPTKDAGFILAGSFTTTPTKGSGGKDIFLIKLDIDGNMLWAKTLGGSGDETVSTVREAADGGLIICGTNRLGNYSTIFLIKTDKNGDLKN